MKWSEIPMSGRIDNAVETSSSTGLDSRAKILLQELDRIRQCHDAGPFVESSLFQSGVEQTFAVDDYLWALETEIDSLLISQAEKRRQRNSSSRAKSLVRKNSQWCQACNTTPCTWAPHRDADVLAKRRKQLYSGIKSAEEQEKRKISEEITEISKSLKLFVVDKELHEAYALEEGKEMTVKSIHGFPTNLHRIDAISALEHEHNRHVGSILANDVVNDVLNWMLDGWYFGQCSNSRSTTILSNPPPTFVKRGSLLDKANDVQMHSNTAAINSLAQKMEKKDKLANLQKTTKYALFCITFSYFRALHLVRQQKEAFSLSRSKPQLSKERLKMIQEHKNCVARQERIEHYMRKAKVGEERKQRRVAQEQWEERRISQFTDTNRLAMNRLAAVVQRTYRGYLGRKTAKNVRLARQKTASVLTMLNVYATDIQCAYRGYCGRRDARRLRRDMAKFLFSLREHEAEAEENDFALRTAD